METSVSINTDTQFGISVRCKNAFKAMDLEMMLFSHFNNVR